MLTLDAKGVITRDAPVVVLGKRNNSYRWQARMASSAYERKLKGVADQVGKFVRGANWLNLSVAPTVEQILAEYAKIIDLWAADTAAEMIASVERKNRMDWQQAATTSKGWRERFSRSAWAEESDAIGRALHKEIATTQTGQIMRNLLDEQVALIKSIPIEAAQRVHEWTLKGMTQGMRYDEIIEGILASGDVARSRAICIARTETARTASVLTQARAQQMGCTHFVWRTANDGNVRHEHKVLNGKVFAFDDPPVIGENKGGEIKGLPGRIWNCRCHCEPILPPIQ